MTFDARTLLIIGGFLCWILAAAIEFQVARPSDRRVLPDAWTLSLICKGAGLNLISQRGLIADAWSISLAHAFLLGAMLLSFVALQRIRGAQTSVVLVAIMPVALALSLPLAGFSQDSFQTRVAIIMSAWTFGFLLNCWSALQVFRSGHRAGASMVLGSHLVIAVAALIFANGVLAREVPGVFGGSGALIAFYATSNVCILLGTFGYMEIVRRTHLQQLQVDASSQPDRLTGLYSASTFSKIGTAEWRRAADSGRPICTLELRIDDFETLQASGGRQWADNAIRRAAAIVLDQIRIYDFAGRISDNAIGIVMPEARLQMAMEVADTIVKAFQADAAANIDGTPLTLSAGVSKSPNGAKDFEEGMARAGSCVEKAQAEGGNRVLSHPLIGEEDLVEDTGHAPSVAGVTAPGYQGSHPVQADRKLSDVRYGEILAGRDTGVAASSTKGGRS